MKIVQTVSIVQTELWTLFGLTVWNIEESSAVCDDKKVSPSALFTKFLEDLSKKCDFLVMQACF